ncbi:MAG: metal ABC transporter permease [Nitrospiraceae bacterium]|nr:metal ABC transporter permease [Nitrospiraceae bacterium]
MILSIFQYAFIRNAFIAGSLVAVVAGFIGYFLATRGLIFAGHALSHIGFAGAAGALVLGVDPIFGLFLFTISAGIGMGVTGKDFREEDMNIGIIMILMLGLGALFISLYAGYAGRAYSILFGTILGISGTEVLVTVIFGTAVCAVLSAVFRPLLFASIDPGAAEARGVPVRLLGVIFLVLVAVAVSMSAVVVGILFVFTLLVGPAATAMRISRKPGAAIALSVALALAYTWLGIFLAAVSSWPVSFYISAIAFAAYAAVRLLGPAISRTGAMAIPAAHS